VSFRDDRLALLDRAEQSEREFASAERELVHARAEHERLRTRMLEAGLDPNAERPGPRALHWLLDRLAPLVWLCAGATMAAAYKSESYGVSVSVGLALTAGAWVASRIARRRHAGARFGLALAGGFVAVALWALFFATLWRAL
jgi:hypothetical protein